MTDAHYGAMASEIRDLIPLLLYPQAIADLRLLADRYERLAQGLKVVPDTPASAVPALRDDRLAQ
jgi:hypothetical protein